MRRSRFFPIFAALAVIVSGGIVYSLVKPLSAAEDLVDSDSDGLADADEFAVYGTGPLAADSDADGFNDGLEVQNGYSPLGPERASEVDADADGLADADEWLFRTNVRVADTDGDGYNDGLEFGHGYDPASAAPVKLKKRIEVTLSKQEMSYFIGPKRLGTHAVSTGRPGSPTPVGTFAVNDKKPRAWSNTAKLWLPWWMPFYKTLYGLHELPEWANGRKEGESSLGKPVSGGCIRLGVGPAKTLYDWVDIGTPVVVIP